MTKSPFTLYSSLFTAFCFLLVACAPDMHHKLLVSIADQKMIFFEDGNQIAVYPISTSKYGVGDEMGSYKTPLGHLYIAKKIGTGMPLGMAFKDRKPTGEILLPNTPGRDPIVTRLLWLHGKEPQNKNAFARYIYIHGTTQEHSLGKPASFGCIRMSSTDVIALYEKVGKGAEVEVVKKVQGISQ
ncbi:MAG: L,D-transpeptidase [Chthoniobacterales bacterium]|nr:L,D-transpeptidase [Chthoniobacterales bacterium]